MVVGYYHSECPQKNSLDHRNLGESPCETERALHIRYRDSDGR